MADLNYIEKSNFEDFFEMKSGYVLDFSDRTFQEFVGDATGKDILDSKYNFQSGSKANRLRAFEETLFRRYVRLLTTLHLKRRSIKKYCITSICKL